MIKVAPKVEPRYKKAPDTGLFDILRRGSLRGSYSLVRLYFSNVAEGRTIIEYHCQTKKDRRMRNVRESRQG